jgi:outer membrane protein assembly factor BamB
VRWGVALLVVGALAAAAAIAVHRLLPRHAHTVQGSTSTEYVPSPPPPSPSEPGVAWPTYGYSQERTRAAPFGLRPPFRRTWTFHGHALLEFPPAVAYGRLYLPTFDGRFYALDAESGRVLWRRRTGRCGWASPAVAREIVYVTFIGSADCRSTTRDGILIALDAHDGALRWRRRLPPTESSPLVVRGTVYVGDWSGDVSAFDAGTGRLRWRMHTAGPVKGSLAFSGGRLFIGNYAGQVLSLDARTGRIHWASGGHGRFYSSPAVAYGRVFIGSLDDGVYAFGATTGHLLWSRPTGGYVYASPAVWRNRVLVGSYDGRFYALDAGTGDVRWRFDAGGRISGAASVVAGVVYFSTFAGRTYALRARDGARVARWNDGKYSPVVADPARLYFVGLGRLSALVPR